MLRVVHDSPQSRGPKELSIFVPFLPLIFFSMGGRQCKMKVRRNTAGRYSKLEPMAVPKEEPPPPQYDLGASTPADRAIVQQACRQGVIETLRNFKKLNDFQQNQVGSWGVPASGLLTRLQLDLRGSGVIGKKQRISWQAAAWYADHVVAHGVPIDCPTLLAGLVLK